ncbi:MAG: hypothetical protein HJJLKODD_01208 [Phycisphaerae bacterium]|nr:hypothetical protein [Phycisphaerae bacterium]
MAGCSERPRLQQELVPRPATPADDVPQLRDGFEKGSLESFWLPGDHGSGRFAPGAVVLTSDYARCGRWSARITVREGDVAQFGDSRQFNERAELDSGKHSVMGQDVWFGFSFLVPHDFPVVDTRLVVVQWKQSGLEGSPVVAQRYVAGRHFVTIRDLRTRGNWRATYDLPKIVPERWNDMVYRIRFSNGADGVVEIWMNGEQVVRCDGPTTSSAGQEQFYHKIGLYRDRMPEPMTIYVDNYAIGQSHEEVDPARFEQGK